MVIRATGSGRGRPVDRRRAERRRAEILEAAATLFAQRGYRQTDLQELADSLGVGKGTIYRYFPSKKRLFLAAVDRLMQRLSAQVRAQIKEPIDPLRMIAQAVRAYLAYFDSHPHFVELLIQERAEFKERRKPTYFQHQEANIGLWKELLARLMAEGRLRRMPVERITNVVSDLLYGTIFSNYFAGRHQSFEVQAREILDVVFLGILSEGERRSNGEAGQDRQEDPR